ncbi:MAG: hypothetical protein ABIG43_00600 [Chloroflexota bacterium]
MIYQITPEWRLCLDETYNRRVENNKLVLWITGRTIVAVVFRYSDTVKKEELIAQLKNKASKGSLEVFESQQDELLRFAYLQPEEVAPGHTRLALYGFTASEATCVQTAFYLDDPSDLDWAKKTWESLIYTPPPPDELPSSAP